MKRQAFINWERVADDNKPENGKQYMVSEIMGDDVAVLRFATWYDKGSIVDIPKEQEENPNMTPEERLLQCIFGSTMEYAVPESGFYLLTSDYGIDDEFKGCTQMLVALSDDIFFAEEPLVPEGYLTEEQAKKRNTAKSRQLMAAAEEERLNRVKTEMENDECVNEAVNVMIDDETDGGELSSDNLHTNVYSYGIYTLSTLDIADKVIEANQAINAVMLIMKREGGVDAIRNTLQEALRSDTLPDCIAQMIDNDELKVSKSIKRYLIAYLEGLITDVSFYRYRDRYAREFDDAARVMVGAHAKKSMVIRLERCRRLREMEAPLVIQVNELRILTNTIIALSNLRRMEDVAEGFATEFGINKDGSKFEGKSNFGDYENQIEYESEDDENTDKNEPEDKYVIVPSPNYAYKEGRYALWQLKHQHYYRENGQVMIFKEWKTARDKREAINK